MKWIFKTERPNQIPAGSFTPSFRGRLSLHPFPFTLTASFSAPLPLYPFSAHWNLIRAFHFEYPFHQYGAYGMRLLSTRFKFQWPVSCLLLTPSFHLSPSHSQPELFTFLSDSHSILSRQALTLPFRVRLPLHHFPSDSHSIPSRQALTLSVPVRLSLHPFVPTLIPSFRFRLSLYPFPSDSLPYLWCVPPHHLRLVPKPFILYPFSTLSHPILSLSCSYPVLSRATPTLSFPLCCPLEFDSGVPF
jgi:hypothetical protein